MSIESWSKFHQDRIQSNYPLWPSEVMVKILFGNYLENKPKLDRGMRVLDVGCGFGNNLLPFYVKGLNCFGCEISSDIIEVVKKTLSERSIEVDLVVGENRKLPYPDNHFDLLISNNVIHYEGTEENIISALNEYRRVLKTDGSLFLMTTGPEHSIYQTSRFLGGQRFQVSNYDFRNGEIYFYFDNEKKLRFYLDKFYRKVETGRVQEKLMKFNLDFFIAHAYK